MIVKKSVCKGKVIAPPSKSMAHRYLICAALADGKSIINNIALSEDIKATLACLNVLGATAEINGDSVSIVGCGGKIQNSGLNHSGKRIFDCNESGSTLRFFIPLSLLNKNPSSFVGSKILMSRPLSVYEEICKNQGIDFLAVDGSIEVQGLLKSGRFSVPGNISSQFITGLLFALPLLDGDSTISITGNFESKPYIDMTLCAQAEFGINVGWKDGKLFVPGGQAYSPKNVNVEGDYSNAAFFEAFNFVGGNVLVEGLNPKSLQGDKIYREYFIKLSENYCVLDISDCPDLGPILFCVAAALHGGEFTGTKRLKLKESDRGTLMCKELSKFGVKTLQEEDRIVIFGGNLERPSVPLDGHNDHRIVMSLVTLLTMTGGKIDGVSAVKKSFPDYFRKLKTLGADFELNDDEKELL